MGKYAKKKQKKKLGGKLLLLIPVLIVLILGAMALRVFRDSSIPDITPSTNEPQLQQPTEPGASVDTQPTQPTEPAFVELTEGLRLLQQGSYAGIYMEDGSDQPVSDVMMLILENTGEQDIQLARISLEYPDFTAEFEVTNLPAGEKLVALEKNRRPAEQEKYLSASVTSLVYFSESMGLGEDTVQITGSNGVLEVTNISDQDISGDIQIYYKNSASDLLYGGITYRVEVKGGLPAGASVQVISGHYSPQNSRIVMVTWGA